MPKKRPDQGPMTAAEWADFNEHWSFAYPRLRSILYRQRLPAILELEDILSETLVKAARGWRDLQHRNNPYGWFKTVCWSVTTDMLRKYKQTASLDVVDGEGQLPLPASVFQDLSALDEFERVEYWDQLPRLRALLQEMPADKVAAVVGVFGYLLKQKDLEQPAGVQGHNVGKKARIVLGQLRQQMGIAG